MLRTWGSDLHDCAFCLCMYWDLGSSNLSKTSHVTVPFEYKCQKNYIICQFNFHDHSCTNNYNQSLGEKKLKLNAIIQMYASCQSKYLSTV